MAPEEKYDKFRHDVRSNAFFLRKLLLDNEYVFAPGLYNAGGMKLAAHAGFQAAYLSGYSYAVEEHGTTDVGAFSRSELVEQAGRMVRAGENWVREQFVEYDREVDPLPLVVDMEDGHGGFGQVAVMTNGLVKAGVAAGHLEDQAERRCGHLPGKVLVTVEKQIERLKSARCEADQLGQDFILIARTDAATAKHTPEGVRGSVDLAVERTLEYARAEIFNRRVIDMAWCEFPNQSWDAIVYWARKIRAVHPDMGLAINLSSSFDWTDMDFKQFSMSQLANEGFKYMFMTLADNHAGRCGSWKFFNEIRKHGIAAFAPQQELEIACGTPSVSHNILAGTKTYFAGGTLFGSKSFISDDVGKSDSELSNV